MADRRLSALQPPAYSIFTQFVVQCSAKGVTVLPICTYRSVEEQNDLYAQGRTVHGKIITNARGGSSYHQYRCAADIVPLRGGKILWNVFSSPGVLEPEWQVMVDAARSLNIEWAGDWIHFREYNHFQYTQGISLKDFAAGAKLK